MLINQLAQLALLFGVVIGLGLSLTWLHDGLAKLSRSAQKRNKSRAAVVMPALSKPVQAHLAEEVPFKVITVRTKPTYDTANDLPKAA